MKNELKAPEGEALVTEAKCDRCDGSGVDPVPAPLCCHRAKFECGGFGCTGPEPQPVPCRDCNGEGKVEVMDDAQRYASGGHVSGTSTSRPRQDHDDIVRGFLEALASGRCYCCGWPLASSVDDGCVPFNCSMRYKDGTALIAEREQWHRRATDVAALHAWARLGKAPIASERGNSDSARLDWLLTKMDPVELDAVLGRSAAGGTSICTADEARAAIDDKIREGE